MPGRWSAAVGRLPSGPVASTAAGAVGRAHGAVTTWRDPARRFARRKRWARRRVVARGTITAGFGALTAVVGSQPGIEFAEGFWGTATGLTALWTVRAARKWYRLHRTPAPPPSIPLPPHGSAARPALERLAERERTLADLVTHLGGSAGETWSTAIAAAGALRGHAARVIAVDRARAGAPPAAQPGLDAALAELVGLLDAGVAGYDELVVAAAAAVSASASFQAADPLLAARLRDATDALAGLAAGLRDVAAQG